MSDMWRRLNTAMVEHGTDQRALIEALQSRYYTVLTRGQRIICVTNRHGRDLLTEGTSFDTFWNILGLSTRDAIIARLNRHKTPVVGKLCFLPFPDKLHRQSNPASTS